jgi:hypothetical protein
MAQATANEGILSPENDEKREQIIEHRRLFEGFLREYEAEGLA